MFASNLKSVRSQNKTHGYVPTIDNGSNKAVSLESGPAVIERNPFKIESLILVNDDWRVAATIWKECLPLLNNVNEIMKKFLSNNFHVKDFHPMIDLFEDIDNPHELLQRFQNCLQRNGTERKTATATSNNNHADHLNDTSGNGDSNVDEREKRTAEELQLAVRD